jgi:hypothetical protein
MLRTESGLPKLCSWNTDHHGKRRVRFRKGEIDIYLTGTTCRKISCAGMAPRSMA